MAGSWRAFVCAAVLAGAGLGLAPRLAQGQLAFPDSTAQTAPNPLTDTTMNPGKIMLSTWRRALPRTYSHAAERPLPSGLPRTAWRWAMEPHRWWDVWRFKNQPTGIRKSIN